jgi:hypothetical protein
MTCGRIISRESLDAQGWGSLCHTSMPMTGMRVMISAMRQKEKRRPPNMFAVGSQFKRCVDANEAC